MQWSIGLVLFKLISYSTKHAISNAHAILRYWKIKTFSAFKLSDVVYIMLTNVKMTNIFWLFNIYEHDKVHAQLSKHEGSFITSGPGYLKIAVYISSNMIGSSLWYKQHDWFQFMIQATWLVPVLYFQQYDWLGKKFNSLINSIGGNLVPILLPPFHQCM